MLAQPKDGGDLELVTHILCGIALARKTLSLLLSLVSKKVRQTINIEDTQNELRYDTLLSFTRLRIATVQCFALM